MVTEAAILEEIESGVWEKSRFVRCELLGEGDEVGLGAWRVGGVMSAGWVEF